MSKKFDATLKEVVDRYPHDWAVCLTNLLQITGWTDAIISDADLSTTSVQADKILILRGPIIQALHFDLHGYHDLRAPVRLSLYGQLAEYRLHELYPGITVRSVLVLLRREANSPTFTGELQQVRPDGTVYRTFRYDVIRVWEMSAADLLNGGVGALPLVLLTDEAAPNLDETLAQVQKRIEADVEAEATRRDLYTASYILAG